MVACMLQYLPLPTDFASFLIALITVEEEVELAQRIRLPGNG